VKVKEEKSWHTVPTASTQTTTRDYQPSLSLLSDTEPLSLVSVSSWPPRGTSGGLSVILLSKSR
jgi:hypothetical protein